MAKPFKVISGQAKTIPTALLFRNIITNKENNRLIKANISGENANVKIIRYALHCLSWLCKWWSRHLFVCICAECKWEIWFWQVISSILMASNRPTFCLAKLKFSFHTLSPASLSLIVGKMFHNNYTTFEVYLKKLMKIVANEVEA